MNSMLMQLIAAWSLCRVSMLGIFQLWWVGVPACVWIIKKFLPGSLVKIVFDTYRPNWVNAHLKNQS